MSVGYSLPKNILGKSGLSNVRFYLSGQNLLTIAKGYKGYDPEGDVSSYYPVTQVYTFGVVIIKILKGKVMKRYRFIYTICVFTCFY